MSTLPRRRARRFRVPRGFLGPRPPAPTVPRTTRDGDRWRVPLALLLGLGLHGAFAVAAWRTAVAPRLAPKPLVTQNVQLERPPPPPAAQPEPPPPPPPPPAHPTRQARRAAEPPAAAVAGRVIARAETPSQPLDFTGFDMVVGKGDTYAGGYTASTGTSKTAVQSAAATPTGHGPDVSHARPPAPGRKDWACAWPDDQQDTDLRDARASIRVHVNRDGDPEDVEIVSSPSPSFAAAARRCAMAESYRTALDDAGHAVAGTTPLFVVHFLR